MTQYLPTNLNAGDKFQLVFTTDGSYNATSTSIDDYNNFVQQAWDISSNIASSIQTYLGLSSITWKCIGSTPLNHGGIHAKDNAVVGSGNDFKGVYRLDGTKVIDNYDALWNGDIDPQGTSQPRNYGPTISYNENGVYLSGGVVLWTGTKINGEGYGEEELGGDSIITRLGSTATNNFNWIDRGSQGQNTNSGLHHLYALSQELTWPKTGSYVDPSAIRSVAYADVAELHANLDPTIQIDDDAHMINIATKRAMTVTEFKQMFYARGDDDFAIANVYDCPNVNSNILASVWGKRVESQATGVLRTNTLKIGPGVANMHFPNGFVSNIAINSILYFTVLSPGWTNLKLNTPYYVIKSDIILLPPTTAIEISETLGGSAIVPAGGQTSSNHMKWWEQILPYNASRIINYNKLSSRANDPSGVDNAYGYANDLQRDFYASPEIMGNLEKDLCMKNTHWTLCSRIAIEDQLHNLAFAPEESDDICMTVNCARKWSEVEDALAESCLVENNIIGLGDYVDLYINVRVTNGNPNAKDTIIRIRFTVQLTRGPDDLGNWNLVTAYIASAILLTGIPYDQPEGGSFQYAANDPVEMSPGMTNRERTQHPYSFAPSNLSNVLDPHDSEPISAYTYTWTHQTSTTDIDLKSVSFISISEGWACGWKSSTTLYNSIILKTNNAGTTWVEAKDNINNSTRHITISMLTDQFGFVGGGVGEIFKWDGISWDNNQTQLQHLITGIHCIGESDAWACGTYSGQGGVAGNLYLYDSGARVFVSPTTIPTQNNINAVFVSSRDIIGIAGVDGTDGFFYITVDGGVLLSNWREGELPLNTPGLNSLFFIGDHGWAAGNDGTIINTRNGGLIWFTQSTPTTSRLESIHFVDINNGRAVGVDGTILKTTDGGNIWTSEYSGTVENLYSVQMISTTLGWIVGNNGTILKYS